MVERPFRINLPPRTKIRERPNIYEALSSFEHWISVVRDPMEHFLSGWAECGARFPTLARRTFHDRNNGVRYNTTTYDQRIQDWIVLTKETIFFTQKCSDKERMYCWCAIHSQPQANAVVMDNNGTVYPQLKVIGHLKELSDLVQTIVPDFGFNKSLPNGRDSAQDKIKQEHFPTRVDWLSNETLILLCDLLALDYFLFDFEKPKACQ
mmetsp:Transcript_2730/g.4676  ORF Transcript_2730/g.4676 Transcript_2730/m.4676 type:complete len:208 (-) Transcript_2730:816-1439(-)